MPSCSPAIRGHGIRLGTDPTPADRRESGHARGVVATVDRMPERPDETTPIRVVVVDDEALVRSGFELILGAVDDIEVVATSDGIGAIDAIVRARPDVVLLDIRMPGVDGLTVLRRIRELPDRPEVAMLTTFDADEYVARALQDGASGFLLKDIDPELLPRVVRTVAGGGVVLSPRTSGKVAQRLVGQSDAPADPGLELLTDREREVLALLGDGMTNAAIASALFLSTATVKDHVSAILTKLAVPGRVQAALIAARAGLRPHGR
jgi:DNA-binding NarL/FixJ family response regulator